MTFKEALRELGLEPGAAPDEIRRAYLRGVKTRKPEVDPDGFRRLREAYEIATGGPAAPLIGEARTEAAKPEDPGQLSELAVAAAQEESFGTAVELAHQALDAAEAQHDIAGILPELILEVVLLLQAGGALAESRSVHDRLRGQIRASGQELALLGASDVNTALWALTQELTQLPDSFPPAIRSAIADALLDGDPASAVPELRSLAKTDPESAEKAAFHLRRLKNLSGYCAVLAQIGPRVDLGPAQRSSQEGVRVLFTLFRLLLFIALFSSGIRSCH